MDLWGPLFWVYVLLVRVRMWASRDLSIMCLLLDFISGMWDDWSSPRDSGSVSYSSSHLSTTCLPHAGTWVDSSYHHQFFSLLLFIFLTSYLSFSHLSPSYVYWFRVWCSTLHPCPFTYLATCYTFCITSLSPALPLDVFGSMAHETSYACGIPHTRAWGWSLGIWA